MKDALSTSSSFILNPSSLFPYQCPPESFEPPANAAVDDLVANLGHQTADQVWIDRLLELNPPAGASRQAGRHQRAFGRFERDRGGYPDSLQAAGLIDQVP